MSEPHDRLQGTRASELADRPVSAKLTEMCWPVFQFVTNFVRQLEHGDMPEPAHVRGEAVAALRDARDLSRADPITDKAWTERVKAMAVYFIDYKMLNSDWNGRNYWFGRQLETSDPPDGLGKSETLGGEDFFQQCNEVQREYEVAERRERKDRDELAGQLNLYYICLRLGFKGGYHDRPIELADYTHRLFLLLPAQSTTRGREMFPEAYKSNQIVKVDYRLGMKMTMVLVIFLAIIGTAGVAFRLAWIDAVGGIKSISQQWSQGLPEKDLSPDSPTNSQGPDS